MENLMFDKGDKRGPKPPSSKDGKDREHDKDAREPAEGHPVLGLLPSPSSPLPKDDPDAPPTEEERRAAAALRDALDSPSRGLGAGNGKEPDLKWLSAHLRVPTADDSLGELRARGLARAAREAVSHK